MTRLLLSLVCFCPLLTSADRQLFNGKDLTGWARIPRHEDAPKDQQPGFVVKDVPAHSLALREISQRVRTPFRLLYGVHAERETALIVLGEHLDRSFYGDGVRRASGSISRGDGV